MTVNKKLNTGKQWGLIKNDGIYGKLVTATGLWKGQRNSRQILQLGSESLDHMNQLKPQIPFARLCTQILIVYTCRITDIHPLNRASQSRLWFNKAFENIITHLIMLKEVIYCSICQCYTIGEAVKGMQNVDMLLLDWFLWLCVIPTHPVTIRLFRDTSTKLEVIPSFSHQNGFWKITRSQTIYYHICYLNEHIHLFLPSHYRLTLQIMRWFVHWFHFIRRKETSSW